jgi:transcriptional regulator GlxA family with amidase domain
LANIVATVGGATIGAMRAPVERNPGVGAVPARQARHYQKIVDRFEGVARASLGSPSHISELSEAAAVSQRTLLRAVRAIHRTTPSRYLHALRLAQAREALLSATKGAETVTQVAMRFGFRELGRFSRSYKATFGESPSDTLRQAPASSAFQRTTVSPSSRNPAVFRSQSPDFDPRGVDLSKLA